MSDLVTWLRAQLDEDERVARDAAEQDWSRALSYAGDLTEHVDMHNPARVLAEVEAKRRLIDAHPAVALTYWPTAMCGICADPDAVAVPDPLGADGTWEPNATFPCPTVRLLALPYADQPGYDESWRP